MTGKNKRKRVICISIFINLLFKIASLRFILIIFPFASVANQRQSQVNDLNVFILGLINFGRKI